MALPSLGWFLIVGVQLFGTYYIIADSDLTVHWGLGRETVPLADIREIRSIEGSYWNVRGYSVHQVEIVYGRTIRRKMRIAPADRKAFIAAMRARCPQLAEAQAGR